MGDGTTGKPLGFGVNLNNREPLIAPDYDLAALLDLSTVVEGLGFDSIWVGDSLFSKPRYEAMTLLGALSQRTRRVRLGTACLVSSTRNPLWIAAEWATLDVISGGRMIYGPCMGSAEVGVRREYEALGLPFRDRATLFEEGLAVVSELFRTGSTSFKGDYFSYDDVSFHSGTEMAPLKPLQDHMPIWIVSNPRLLGDRPTDQMQRIMTRACGRVVEHGDGWMTCCRAQHPEELTEQIGYLTAAAGELGRDWADYTVSYQVTMNIKDTKEQANAAIDEYIGKYYPELSRAMDLSNWGPVGTPDDIVAWIREFADRGVNHFICRFGDLDQFDQVERFAKDVLPAFRGAAVDATTA
ncbi:MAG TPA: LLM class flavin-dependent oxidoreductase [Conexibacter sp.]|jgi:alkanesulfonate monooxygenase SsuD/methylene tetrahydromethanopterin reductase-like flavin-dependent oxidoreductase (luciferase family)